MAYSEEYLRQLEEREGSKPGNYGLNGSTESSGVASQAIPITPAEDQTVQHTNIAIFIIPAVAVILIISVVAFKLGKRHR